MSLNIVNVKLTSLYCRIYRPSMEPINKRSSIDRNLIIHKNFTRNTMPPTEIRDIYTGRVWPVHLVIRFIVGHLYGSYDFTQTCLHLRIADPSFIDVTNEELRRFWNVLMMTSTIYPYWACKGPEDVDVQIVLQDIATLMVDA